jgi:hypothetical protein
MLPTRRRENQKRRVDGSGDPGPAAGELPLPADSTRPTDVFARLSRSGGRGRKADDGSRTRYLELGKLALYQVSYVRS